MRHAFYCLLALAFAMTLGCGDESDDTNTDTDIVETTISLNGVGVDIATVGPVAEGRCVDIIDSTNAVTGGESETLASTTTGTGPHPPAPRLITSLAQPRGVVLRLDF
jgi:hypothetical protein